MTQYFRIQPEQDTYMHFELDSFDFLDKLGEEFELSDFDKPMLHAWQPVKGKFYPKVGEAREIPDVTTWQTDILILNQKAHDVLQEYLESMGEFLPIEIESVTYYLFHMLECLSDDVIDTDNSEYEYHKSEDDPVGFKVLSFNAENIPQDKPVFCVQNNFAYNIYCDERFKSLLSENGLGGLAFNTTLIDPYFK